MDGVAEPAPVQFTEQRGHPGRRRRRAEFAQVTKGALPMRAGLVQAVVDVGQAARGDRVEGIRQSRSRADA